MTALKPAASLIAGLISLFLLSCNSGDDETKTDENLTDSSELKATETTQENKPPTDPNKLTNVAIVKHKVADYSKWKAGYDGHDSDRKAYGLSNYLVGRGTPDSNTVFVLLRVADTAKANEFAKLPSLKDAMKKAGVVGQPSITLIDVAWNNTASINQPQQLVVTHRVKDFETWRKVFESDRQVRIDAGLVDLGYGSTTGDNHSVTVVFAVNDMAKAKALIGSRDLKDKMAKAGVEGPPAFFFYKVTESY